MKQTEANNSENNLLNGRRLTRNVFWNFIGMIMPLCVAIVTIPILIKGIGIEKFGVLSIIWMVIGYFSLFDLGLGRTLTKLVAEKLGKDQPEQIPTLVWTTIALMSGISILGSLIIYGGASWLVHEALNLPAYLQNEVKNSFQWLALSIPFVILTTAFRGILEAYQMFGWVNAIRIPLGLFTFLGPVAVLPFTSNLEIIVIVLLLGRIFFFSVHVFLCLHRLPMLQKRWQVSPSFVPYLLSFGGWMTVTNLIGPLMVYLDRFLIGAVLTLSAVAFYATPYEMITKLWILPGIVLPVLFPAFSTAQGQGGEKISHLYYQGMLFVFISMFPLSLLVTLFSFEGLGLWLNKEFAYNSYQVLQLLAYGVFINSFAQISFTLIQGVGRPDLTAKLHLIELPFYLLGLWILMPQYGIIGVALMWTLRITFDTIVLFIIVNHLLPEVMALSKRMGVMILLALFVIIGSSFLEHVMFKIVYLFSVLTIFTYLSWHYLFGVEEQQWVRNIIRSVAKQVLRA